MTQDERWLVKYNEVKDFIETNQRNPSKFIPEERGLRNWVRHQQKLVNKGELKAERMDAFNKLLELTHIAGRFNVTN